MERAAELLKPGTRKIAIVGFTEHWAQAPFENDEWTVWCMNDFWRISGDRWRHADAWFDMHRPAERHTKPGALEWVAKWDRPYVTPEQPDGYAPNPVVFPRDDVLKVFDTGYYTNTVSWLIGLAALLLWEAHSEWAQAKAAGRDDADELRPVIGVYGVDMAADCVAPTTLVLRDDLSWVEAGKLNVGDRLVSFDAEPDGDRCRQWRTGTVTYADRKMKECYEVEFADGTKIVASGEHPWLTYAEHTKRWRTTRELATTHHRRQTRVCRAFEPWENSRTWEAGYLAAALDGEGHLSQTLVKNGSSYSCALGFAQRGNLMLDTFEAAAASLGFDLRGSRSKSDSCHKLVLAGGRAEVMRLLGTVRPPRLLDQFDLSKVGGFRDSDRVKVVSVSYVGEREVAAISVDCGTYLAEGFAVHNSEYASQRPSCEWLLGLAAGAGFAIELAVGSDLLKAAEQYGYGDGALATKISFRRQVLTERSQQLSAQRQAKTAELAAIDNGLAEIRGALSELGYFESRWTQKAANSTRDEAS